MSVKQAIKEIGKAQDKITKSTEAINDGKLERAVNRNDEADEKLVKALDELEEDEEEEPEQPVSDDEFQGVFVVDGNNANDIQGWPITAEITDVKIVVDNICLTSVLGKNWPPNSDDINGNPWIIWKIGGIWYGATYEWLRSSLGGDETQECKKLGADGSPGNTVADLLAPHMKSTHSDGWVPQKDEEVYLFIASLSRLSDRSVNERSQIVKVSWPF